MTQNREVQYRRKLSEQELEGIEILQEKGTARGVSYKLDPGLNSGIVCSRNGVLTGFMTVDCFGGEEIESAALVEDLTDWEEMVTVLKDCAKEKNTQSILFICDPKDILLKEKLESLGLAPAFTEYRMAFDRESFVPAEVNGISLRQATGADAGYIKGLDRGAFGDGEGDVPPRDIACTKIILRKGEPAGKLRLNEADGMHGIYGVVVDSCLRGQGIGYQAITLLLRELMACGASNIYLEVDSQNLAAFHLYQKLGFRVRSAFGYYSYSL